MPALDLYTSPAIIQPRAPPQQTRPNSEERGDAIRARNVSPDPISNLIEATRLNGLRSQLRSVKQRRKGGMRRKDHDLISEGLLGVNDADELLELFQRHQAHHLFSAGISSNATVESLRASSTVLFTAVMLVAALLVPGKEVLHENIHGHFMGVVSSVMWDRFHTLDDIRGLVIAAFWQPYLSWKLSGLSIRMATELNLHHAFYTAFSDPDSSDEQRRDCVEKTRIWYLLYVLDHQFSIAYGRPPCMNELRPIKDFDLLLRSEICTESDRALIAQVTNLAGLGRAFEHFGLNPKRVMDGQDSSVLNHLRFTDNMVAWRERWTDQTTQSSELSRNITLQFHFSNLVLNSIVLRGRPLEKLCELPTSLRPLALHAVESAHRVLEQFLYDPRHCAEIVGMPLYLHSMIAFAVVFLLKMAHRWIAIGITISPADRTMPLIEAIICRLHACRAGANHMVFSMAKGFERMLKQVRSVKSSVIRPSPIRHSHTEGPSTTRLNASRASIHEDGPQNIPADFDAYPSYAESLGVARNAATNNLSPGEMLTWGFQDEELWSVGMGYDLLEPGGQGLASLDFPFQTPAW
ncbi:hypothetical protein AC578_9733 [Pseudocercospora eumusae]|uniref:Xylanolytic transcriptional activator regulatory domain-containing protein n=1 Tax=Pseudocercospora eumusae TaxID=321146 RepID=A0A139HQW3_9PEZI|nr:hypothetical protein AC578_9733 [Pseudocercospora eumusae]